MAVTAKISQRSKEIARELMDATGTRQIDVIEHALLVYRRQWRMQQTAKAFANLKKDEADWDSLQEEMEDLEGTIGDGLEEDE